MDQMSYAGDIDIGRNVLRRVEVIEVNDEGTQQFATVKGLAGEQIKLAYRGQYFGASGVPPIGSDGFALLIGGRPDQAVLFGIEHKDHRVRGLQPGEKAIYDASGQVIKLIKTGPEIVIDTPGKVTIKAVGNLVIEADIEITGDITQAGSITSTGAHSASAHT